MRAFASGVLSVMGHNPTIAIRQFEGEVGFDPDKPEEASLRMKIDAGELAVQDDIKEKDRHEIEQTMKEKVLEIDKYPHIVFESSEVSVNQIAGTWYRARLAGDLQLHGANRRQEIQLNLRLKDDSLNAEGDFTLKQTDFNIEPVSIAGGALKLKDELKFSFNIKANKA